MHDQATGRFKKKLDRVRKILCSAFRRSNKNTSTDQNTLLNIKADTPKGSRFSRNFFDLKTVDLFVKSCPKTTVA